MLKKFARSGLVLRSAGWLLGSYFMAVFRTGRFVHEPADFYSKFDPHVPLIVALWHGQHFLSPFAKRPSDDVRALVSRHADGEINARAAARMGLGLVRGSGDTRGRFHRKGGMVALRELIRALQDGGSVALTADVPKGPAKRAGEGIVLLAKISGRPIVPLAVATRWRIRINSWDKADVNLPFSKGAMVAGEAIYVPADADEETLEAFRVKVEDGLNAATRRAYDIVDA